MKITAFLQNRRVDISITEAEVDHATFQIMAGESLPKYHPIYWNSEWKIANCCLVCRAGLRNLAALRGL